MSAYVIVASDETLSEGLITVACSKYAGGLMDVNTTLQTRILHQVWLFVLAVHPINNSHPITNDLYILTDQPGEIQLGMSSVVHW